MQIFLIKREKHEFQGLAALTHKGNHGESSSISLTI